MTGGKVSDEVIDAIAFIEMHRQETEKESGSGVACAQALPKLQELFEQLNGESAEPADVHAANMAAVTNEIARVKRFASGGHGNQGGGNKFPRPGGGGQRKQAPRPHGQGHSQNQNRGQPNANAPAGAGAGPNQGQGRRRGRNKRRGGGGGSGGAAGGGQRGPAAA